MFPLSAALRAGARRTFAAAAATATTPASAGGSSKQLLFSATTIIGGGPAANAATAAAAEDFVEIHPQFGSGCLICSDPNPSPSCRRCEGDLSATIPLHDTPWSYDL